MTNVYLTFLAGLGALLAVFLADRYEEVSPFWRQVMEVMVAFDRFVNTCLNGSADETMSRRAHRMRVKGHRYWGWTANAIDLLFFWQKGHCLKSYLWEVSRSKTFPEVVSSVTI